MRALLFSENNDFVVRMGKRLRKHGIKVSVYYVNQVKRWMPAILQSRSRADVAIVSMANGNDNNIPQGLRFAAYKGLPIVLINENNNDAMRRRKTCRILGALNENCTDIMLKTVLILAAGLKNIDGIVPLP